MRELAFICLSVALTLGSINSAYAGSPSGLHIIVVPTDEAIQYTERISSFFNRYYDGHSLRSCNNHALNIDNATIHPKDNVFSAKEILRIDGKKNRKKLAAKLTAYRDEYHPDGADAALVIYVENDALVLRSFSALVSEAPHTARIRLADISNEHAVDLSACKVLAELPVMREP